MRPHRLAVTGAAALWLAALAVPASAARPSSGPAGAPAPGGRAVIHFDLQAGQQPENIALEPGGAADLTFALIGQVARVTPGGHLTTLATLPPAPAGAGAPVIGVPVTGGIVRAPDGTRFVNYSTGTADLTGIWAFRPGGTPTRIAALPATSFANGLARAADGTLYVADSAQGAVWRVRPGGAPAVWASGPQLAPAGFLGANGIKTGDGAVWVTNTDQGTLLRIPIGRHGAAGPVKAVATGLAGIDDFTFAGHGEFLAAINAASELVRIRPDGTHTVVLTSAGGLSNPTSAAIAGRTLYVASAAYTTGSDPNLLLTRVPAP
jgi:sugar lactone lactonase YvrE